MYTLTMEQAFEIIDLAAKKNKLYHYNGGMAYIKYSNKLNILLVIDHTGSVPKGELSDGTRYFESCKNYNNDASKALRENGSLLEWYKNTQKVTT
jgi:hypothetical protein